MKELTKRQKAILNFIKAYLREHKYPPTVREIAANFEISAKGSYDHLRALKKKKYIKTNGSRSRAIEIMDQDDEVSYDPGTTDVPILGKVAAGKSILSEENYDGCIEVPYTFVRNGVFFALKIVGDSMIEAGILEGDIGIIRQQSVAENGEIVVAMLEDSYTIKYFIKEKNRIKLQPANPAYRAIYAKNDVHILGKLVYLIRNYAK